MVPRLLGRYREDIVPARERLFDLARASYESGRKSRAELLETRLALEGSPTGACGSGRRTYISDEPFRFHHEDGVFSLLASPGIVVMSCDASKSDPARVMCPRALDPLGVSLQPLDVVVVAVIMAYRGDIDRHRDRTVSHRFVVGICDDLHSISRNCSSVTGKSCCDNRYFLICLYDTIFII